MALAITTECHGRRLRLRLRGELDVTSRHHLISAVTAVLGHRGAQSVVMDLSEVGFADCSGLSVLVWAYGCLAEFGQDLAITGAQPIVRRLLHVTGLDTHLPLG